MTSALASILGPLSVKDRVARRLNSLDDDGLPVPVPFGTVVEVYPSSETDSLSDKSLTLHTLYAVQWDEPSYIQRNYIRENLIKIER